MNIARLINKLGIVMLCLLLPFPSIAFAGNQEREALKAYVDALSKGDVAQISSLLSPNFEYDYYKNGEHRTLSRDEELKALGQLFHDLHLHSFNEPDLFVQDKERPDTFHVKFSAFFEDSPKDYTESLFRGAVLDLDERLTVTLDNNKILKVVEERDEGRPKKLSFGFLKFVHSGSTEEKVVETEKELIIELYDKTSHELLLIKDVTASANIIETYYWPDKQVIENFPCFICPDTDEDE
jgi:hypothetical protein